MSALDELLPLIKEDGEPFTGEEVATTSEALATLSVEERVDARNRNSDAIAAHDARRMLLVSGPGTGKSTLFKARMKHWLAAHPEQQVSIATFVRKLVRDLNDDVATDDTISDEERSRIGVMTLHGLARSIIERNGGTQELPLKQHCLVITREWEEMVWQDTVTVRGDAGKDFAWATLLEHLYDGEPPTEATWAALRAMHMRLERFYNALTFADLILFGAQAAVENPELVAGTLFIIDEFQDFNLAEDALIRAITNESPAVLLAGDDDQVLYDRLRRAHPSIIRGYYRDTSWVNAMLPFCSRCGFHICRAAESFLAQDRPPESIEKVFLPLEDEERAELVTVVASTSPKTGVQYVEQYLRHHEAAINQRREELIAGSKKDAYVLILTPAREMNFLNVAGARDALRNLIHQYAAGDERLSPNYWKVLDYYFVGVRPKQNFNLRKVLSHEGVEQDVVTALLRNALDTDQDLAGLDHEAVRTTLQRCIAVREILEAETPPQDKADDLIDLGVGDDAATLARDLERRPVRGGAESGDEESQPEQNETVGAVDVTTIVGAKGLTADHVIVLGCDDVNLEPVSRSAFLVALTRARKSLTLVACVGGGGATTLHTFVRSLPDSHTRALFAKAGGANAYETIGDLQEHLEKWAYAKSMSTKKRS